MLRTRLPVLLVLACVPEAAWPQGDPLGPEFRVNTYTADHQQFPSLAADSAGNFIVVWTSNLQDGSGQGVFGQRYASSGTPVGPEFQVNTYTTGVQNNPGVASDAGGNFVVVWNSSDGSSTGVFGQRYDSSGAPLGPEFRVNTYTTGAEFDPAVASDASGNFIVVWQGLGAGGIDIFGQRYAATGAPLGSEFRVNTFTAGCQYSEAVTSDPSGNFVVAWQDDVGGGGSCPPGTGVFGRRFAASGVPLAPEFRANTYTTGFQGDAAVAADAGGNAVIVWFTFQPPATVGIFGQRYDSSGAPVGSEFQVDSTVAFLPAVALDASGDFVVTWTSATQDGSSYGIFGQRYASSGAPLGQGFRVNTYTTGGQLRPSVSTDSAGRFVVVWQSNGQDGSGYGIFGQRFGPIVPVELMHFRVE